MDITMYLYIIMGFTIITSLIGFNNPNFTNRFIYNQGLVQVDKQYYRFLSSGFLHANFLHLFFNMYVLYMFGTSVIHFYEVWEFLILYLGGIIAGGALSYMFNLNNYNYTALGASAGVTAVLLVSVAIQPNRELGLIFIPGLGLQGYIFAFLYMCYEVYAMIKQTDNVGHDAHIGGGLFGLVFAAIASPELMQENWKEIGLMVLPMIYAVYYIYNKNKKLT